MTKELQAINQEHTISLWAERISACRNSNLSVAQWCKENEVCVQTYYRWQKKLFTMTQAQQESRFAEVTPFRASGNIEVTVRIAMRYNKFRKLKRRKKETWFAELW